MKSHELTTLRIEEFLKPGHTLNPSDTISKVIGRMRETKSRESFLEVNDRTAVITLRDVLNVKSITTTKASAVMRHIPRLSPSASVGEAARTMIEYKVDSLPIYNSSSLRGQISCTSVVDQIMLSDHIEKASSVMTPNPICVQTSDEAAKARRIMLKEKIDHIPILNDSKLAGVITSTSIAFNLLPDTDRNVKGDWRGARFDIPVLDYAEDDYVTNDVTDSLSSVFKNIKKRNSDYSVITNFDEVQGIITTRDFMRLLVEQRSTVDNVPMYMIGLPDDPFEAQAAKDKFVRVVTLLHKEYPDMQEARAIIKYGKTKATKSRYEVQIFVKTSRNQFSYEGSGYELPEVFDGISNWSKRQLARIMKKPKRRTRADPGSPEDMV